jgi:phospholipase C
MMRIHTTRRFAGLVGAVVALSAASPAALAHRTPPGGSGGSTQAQTPMPSIATGGGRGVPRPVQARQASPIRHVVVIYLENHSFDNLLGYWCDQNPGRCPDGGMPATVTLSNGVVVRPKRAPDVVPNVNHSVAAQVAAMNIVNGVPLMNGWENIPYGGGNQFGCTAARHWQCITGYEPSQIPNITNLATRFAISDDTFSMADSPSWGGHLYAAMGSLDGFTGDNPFSVKGVTPPPGPGWGCDSNLVTPWIAPDGKHHPEPSCIPDYHLNPAEYPHDGAFRHTPAAPHATIFDGLAAAGLTWRIYGQAVAEGHGASDGYGWSICPSLAQCLYTSQRADLVDSSQFFADATAGTLPAFSIVTAGGSADGLGDGKPGVYTSCHNGFSMTACDDYIGALVGAVEDSPDWSSTAVFITFDDFGGFYDQVPPGTNPDGTQQGPRSPLIIVSPYARPGFTDTTPASFASILAYTERNFGLAPLGPNDAGAYSYSAAFSYSQQPDRRVHMVRRPVPKGDRIQWWEARQDS